jgi:F-box-like
MKPDPRLAPYLISNDPLPDKLRIAVNDCISQLQQQILSLDDERSGVDLQVLELRSQIQAIQERISSLTQDRNQIQAQRAQAQKEKTQYEATISQVRRIPPEVVASILGFALHNRDRYLGRSERRQFKRYQCVCRLWRATSLSSPTLWRAIRIGREDFPRYTEYWGDKRLRVFLLECVKSWFSRGGSGAHVRLAISPVRGLDVDIILEVIHRSGFHFTTLSLDPGEAGCHFDKYRDLETLSGGPHNYPSITSLSISLRDTDGGRFETCDLAQSFPALTTFTLYSYTGVRIRTTFVHPTLQHLNLCYCSYASLPFSRQLQNLPNLKNLQLYSCTTLSSTRQNDLEADRYAHPNLRMVTFTDSVPVGFFENLAFSSLKFLRVEGDLGTTDSYSNAGKGLSNFIVDSLPSNITLVAFAKRQSPMIRELLTGRSSIMTLSIRSFSDLDPVAFTEPAQGEGVEDNLPRRSHFLIPSSLESVRCIEKSSEDVFWAWADMIERYLRPDQTLKVEAPGCSTPSLVLELNIPEFDFVGTVSFCRSLVYRENALLRAGKFLFCYYPLKTLAHQRRRIKYARMAVRKHMVWMSMKGVARKERRQPSRRSAIFSMPLVS